MGVGLENTNASSACKPRMLKVYVYIQNYLTVLFF